MKIINAKHSYSGWALLLLLWVIVAITMIIVIIVTSDNYIDWEFLFGFTIPIVFFIFILPSIFFVDIFSWHFFGEEIIYINKTELEIRKVGRLFKRKKNIKLNQIKDIYLWQKKIRDIHILLAFWDISKQGGVCIKYKGDRKYYIGVNMSNIEAEVLRQDLVHELCNNDVR
jgi:hypothetical protein